MVADRHEGGRQRENPPRQVLLDLVDIMLKPGTAPDIIYSDFKRENPSTDAFIGRVDTDTTIPEDTRLVGELKKVLGTEAAYSIFINYLIKLRRANQPKTQVDERLATSSAVVVHEDLAPFTEVRRTAAAMLAMDDGHTNSAVRLAESGKETSWIRDTGYNNRSELAIKRQEIRDNGVGAFRIQAATNSATGKLSLAEAILLERLADPIFEKLEFVTVPIEVIILKTMEMVGDPNDFDGKIPRWKNSDYSAVFADWYAEVMAKHENDPAEVRVGLEQDELTKNWFVENPLPDNNGRILVRRALEELSLPGKKAIKFIQFEVPEVALAQLNQNLPTIE